MCISFNLIVSPLFVTGLGNLKAQVTPGPWAHAALITHPLNVLLQACTSWSQRGLWWWWWASWDAVEPSKSRLSCWDWWVISFVLLLHITQRPVTLLWIMNSCSDFSVGTFHRDVWAVISPITRKNSSVSPQVCQLLQLHQCDVTVGGDSLLCFYKLFLSCDWNGHMKSVDVITSTLSHHFKY